jgi:hypothetical protein
MVAEPTDGRAGIAPVIGVAATAGRGRAQIPAALAAGHALPHAVHRLQEAAAHLAKVAEAARVLHAVGLHVDGGGGGGHQGGRAAESVQLGEKAFAGCGAEACRPKSYKN